MIDPLDHDGDGRKGGSLPKKRGRPAKAAETAPVASKGKLRVVVADMIHDGQGGFLAVGTMFDAVDDEAAEQLKARGLAE